MEADLVEARDTIAGGGVHFVVQKGALALVRALRLAKVIAGERQHLEPTAAVPIEQLAETQIVGIRQASGRCDVPDNGRRRTESGQTRGHAAHVGGRLIDGCVLRVQP